MRIALAVLIAALTTTSAGAVPVQVTITGTVEDNQITIPPFDTVVPLDAAVLTFEVDSDVFINSPNFPTRGYPIDPASFSLLLGAAELGLQDPFPPSQTPYFSLRDNDPAVDGFFVATSFDLPIGVPLDVTGAFDQFRNLFSVTYEGDVLSSLDITGAAGTYDFDQLTVFGWTIDDGPFQPLLVIFSELTISVDSEIFTDGFESGDTSSWSSTTTP